MKKTRLKLRSEIVVLIAFIFCEVIFIASIGSLNEKLKKCDMEKNRTCSYYEVHKMRG